MFSLFMVACLTASVSSAMRPAAVRKRDVAYLERRRPHSPLPPPSAASPAQGPVLFGIIASQCVRIDPVTGNTTNIGPPLSDDDLLGQQENVLDGRVLYVLSESHNGTQSVLCINVDTGVVVKRFKIPIAPSPLVGVGTYIDLVTSGKILVAGHSVISPGNHDIFTCTTINGKCTKIASVQRDTDVLGATHYFNPVARIWMLEFAVGNSPSTMRFVYNGYNIDTGKLVIANLTDPHFIQSGWFYSGSFWGIGFADSSFETRAFARWTINATSLSSRFEIVASIPDYLIMQSGMTTFDASAGFVFALLQSDSPDPQTTPFDLLTLDLAGNIYSRPHFCTASNCPWAMVYVGK